MGTTRERTLVAESFGCATAWVQARSIHYERSERFKRAARIFFPLLGGALASLPIPGWHLAAVPGFLIGGIVLGARRLRQPERLVSLEGPCPACGRPQAFEVPSRLVLPHTLRCPACGEFVKLHAGPAVATAS